MASLQYIQSSTLQSVSLGSAYTAGSGTMTLTAGNGAYLPSSGDFWLSYNNGAGTVRLFKVTARATDTLTVTAVSGEGSGDGNISSGETLRWALTYDALNQLKADIVAAGGLVLLETKTASASASLDFTASISSTYDVYEIVIQDLLPSVDGAALNIQVSTDGGATYITTSSYHWSAYVTTGGSGAANGNVSTTAMTFNVQQDSATGSYASNGTIRFYNPLGTTNFKTFMGITTGVVTAGVGLTNIANWNFFGNYKSTNAINAFRIIPSSGNLDSGIVRCYGLKK